MVNYQNQPRSLKQKNLSWGGSLALHTVGWLAMCLFEIAVFEMAAFIGMDTWTITAYVKNLHYKKEKQLSGLTQHCLA